MFAGGSLGLNISLAPGISTKNLLLYVLFTWIAIEAIVTHNRKIICLSVIAPFSALLAYAIFSLLVVVLIIDYANYNALQNAISLKSQMADSLFMLLVFLFGLTNAKDTAWLYRMVVWLVVLGNILTLADAFQLLDLGMLAWHHEGRLNGFLGQPNEYGAFLVIFLPATVALFIVETGIRRVLAAIGVLTTFVCLLLTFSRGSYVGVILGSLLGAVFLRKYVPLLVVTRVAIAMVVTGAIAVPLLFIAGFDDVFRDRFSLTGGNVDTLTTGRSTLWSRAFSVMLQQPISFLTGFGWNAYDSFREFRLSIHNVYFNHLFDLGLIGLTLFVSTLSAALFTLRRGVEASAGDIKAYLVAVTVGTIGICVNMFSGEVYTTGLLMWAFIGLSLRMAVETYGESERAAKSVGADRTGLAGAG
jgi:O-antigen ligase